MSKLGIQVKAAITHFAYQLANGNVGYPLLKSVDYSMVFRPEDASAFEQAFAIYCNVLELDDRGQVRNPLEAERRAAQYIRQYCDPDFATDPPFEEWETERTPYRGPESGPMA